MSPTEYPLGLWLFAAHEKAVAVSRFTDIYTVNIHTSIHNLWHCVAGLLARFWIQFGTSFQIILSHNYTAYSVMQCDVAQSHITQPLSVYSNHSQILALHFEKAKSVRILCVDRSCVHGPLANHWTDYPLTQWKQKCVRVKLSHYLCIIYTSGAGYSVAGSL